MTDNTEQGTDGASIKPVSSLRSHFEGLNLRRPSHGENSLEKEAIKTPKPPERVEDTIKPTNSRASLEFPTGDSARKLSRDHVLPSPRASVSTRKRALSPPKAEPTRPTSTLTDSTPHLAPSVNVDPPKSPPKGYFFNRSTSRSPERSIDSTPFGKVRELISQHSSRSSSRTGTPQAGSVSEQGDRLPSPTRKAYTAAPHAPPPINRAEKPKIPVKPSTFTVQEISNAFSKPRNPSSEARLSPFSTPPSSDEESHVEQTSRVPSLTHQPHAQLHSNQARKQSFKENDNEPLTPKPIRAIDPRMLGFSRAGVMANSGDSRSDHAPPMPPRPSSRDSPMAPTRANTVSERPITKDSRDLALPKNRPSPRHVSENIRSTPPPFDLSHNSQAARPNTRDPRLFGFSNTASIPTSEQDIESAYRRPSGDIAPRPPDASKRSLSRPGRQPSPSNPEHVRKPSAAKIPAATISLVTEPSKEMKFPPPPKRITTNEVDSPLMKGLSSNISSNRVRDNGYDSDEAESTLEEPATKRTDYPDSSHVNRQPPYFHQGLREVSTVTDTRTFDACGRRLCTTGYVTRVFDLETGEAVMSLNHGQSTTLKVLSIIFKPANKIEEEGDRIWIGNNAGDLQEIDIETQTIMATNSSHSRRAILQILRCRKELWSLDDEGKLFVWPAHETGAPDLRYSHVAHRVQKGHTFSIVVGDKLWLATGKEVRIYNPGNESNFTTQTSPLSQAGTGDITAGTVTQEKDPRVYFGHAGGNVSVYSAKNYSCLGVVKASDYRINGLAFAGGFLWAGYKTGKIYVYDTSCTPWKVKKDFKAHSGPVSGLLVDPSSTWTMQKLHVVSLGQDMQVRLWDGMLQDDWLEAALHEHDSDYSSFRELRAAVASWNVGAASPLTLKIDDFIAEAINAQDPPELLIFGFQEVIDLEDKGVATKGILGFAKKKEAPKVDQYQGGVYREWRDYLQKTINRATSPNHNYVELSTSHLIGLFQCVFIRSDERPNIHGLSTTNVKCGMGGHYGNKGCLVTRFILDDSSLCFVNAHLAAGQRQTSNRNNDAATILEDESLPPEPDFLVRSTFYIGGGDGSQILDHEITVLSGDLNYRIDAIPRDTVLAMLKRGDIQKLLDRDQMNVSRRRVSGFRLSTFTEMPITFLPTYKYDVGTEAYDTSDKKRAPAWCDRILYRGGGSGTASSTGTATVMLKVKQLDYRRHDGLGLRESDHRPVSALFRFTVKKVDRAKQRKVRGKVEREWEGVRKRMSEDVCVRWLAERFGVKEEEARGMMKAG